MNDDANPLDAAEGGEGDESAAVGMRRIRLTRAAVRELRLALLGDGSPFSVELVEERYANGDVVVRLARPDMPARGELILGAYNTGKQQAAELLPDDAI